MWVKGKNMNDIRDDEMKSALAKISHLKETVNTLQKGEFPKDFCEIWNPEDDMSFRSRIGRAQLTAHRELQCLLFYVQSLQKMLHL